MAGRHAKSTYRAARTRLDAEDQLANSPSLRSRRPVGRAATAWWRQVGLFVLLLLGTAAVITILDVGVSFGRVHPRVSVGGVSVGGLTPSGATQRLAVELGRAIEEPVTVVFEKKRWTIDPKAVGASVDATELAASAYAAGRQGGLTRVVADRALMWFRGVDLPASAMADPGRLDTVLGEVSDVVDVEPRDASVEIDGTDVRLVPATVGVMVQSDTLKKAVLRAFLADGRSVTVDVDLVPVSVTEEDATEAFEDAKAMLSGPVKITYEGGSWEFGPDRIARWVSFRKVRPSLPGSASANVSGILEGSKTAVAEAPVGVSRSRMILRAEVSATELSATVGDTLKEAGRPAKDARFVAGGGSVSIVPSQDGLSPDVVLLARHMTRVLASSEPRTVALRMRRVAPTLSTEQARGMGIKERVCTYTTRYDPSNKPRVNNIHTLAAALDGALVAPGATFSFNGQIGPRTAEKGYREAPAIVNGKLVPQLGGGICQVCTTFFNTVLLSGLPVVERHNHSFYISHYPKGRDATVSWGGPDFKFRNDTKTWYLVKTAYSASSLTISLYGTDPGYKVGFEASAFSNVKPHPVREVEDNTMPEGARTVIDSGVDGRRIAVTRSVKKGDRLVREDTFVSVYRPKEEVVRVGTKPRSTSPTSTPTTPTPAGG